MTPPTSAPALAEMSDEEVVEQFVKLSRRALAGPNWPASHIVHGERARIIRQDGEKPVQQWLLDIPADCDDEDMLDFIAFLANHHRRIANLLCRFTAKPAAAQEVTAEWQPIETAPLAKMVLLWHRGWRHAFPGQLNGDNGACYIDTCEIEARGWQTHASHWKPLDNPGGRDTVSDMSDLIARLERHRATMLVVDPGSPIFDSALLSVKLLCAGHLDEILAALRARASLATEEGKP